MKIFIEDTNIPTFIERLCGRKTGIVLFDSTIHRWNQNDSEFYRKLNGKSNVCIVVFDTDGNIFGGYAEGKVNVNQWNSNSNTFVFSIKKNGMFNPKKYPLKGGNRYGFSIEYGSRVLFGFGGKDKSDGGQTYEDLCIRKKDYSTWGYCDQHSFDYNGETNALCGSDVFNVSRIYAYEMEETQKQTTKKARGFHKA